jgi:glycosyltransferase involved in cell wall biosynthesis
LTERGDGGGRIRVLQAITRMIVGGAQLHALHLCQRLDPCRFETELLTGPELGPEGDLLTAARASVSTTVVEPLGREIRPLRDLRAYRMVREHLRRRRFHIVHTNTSKAGILVRRAARAAEVPVIVHTVHGWQWTHARTGWMNRFIIASEREAARYTDRLVVVAGKDREKGLAAGVGRPEQYVLIESAIALDRFDPARVRGDLFRASRGIPPGAPVAGTVGRFAYQKAPEVMLSAARRILSEHPEAHFVYVGDGPQREDVLGRMGDFAGNKRLHLVGLQEDVVPILAAFDVFLLSSRYEGLPRVVVEAMAMEKPVVSTPADGVVEVVVPGETGVLVPHGDDAALAREALTLLRDRERACALGRRGRETAVVRFDLDTMIHRTERLYDELLREKGLL